MGGSSGGGSATRPEVQAEILPSPPVRPINQPDPGVRTQYGQYYLPPNLEALRMSLMSGDGPMPFGVRSPYRQVDPSSSYAAPRAPQIFSPSSVNYEIPKAAPTPRSSETPYEANGQLKAGWGMQKVYTKEGGVVEMPIWVGISDWGGGGSQ